MPPLVIKPTSRIRIKIEFQPHTRARTHTHFSSDWWIQSFFKASPLEKSTAHYPVMAIGWTWNTTGRNQLLCCANFLPVLHNPRYDKRQKSLVWQTIFNNWLITKQQKLHQQETGKRNINIITRSLHNPNSNPRQTQSSTSTQCSTTRTHHHNLNRILLTWYRVLS